MIIKVFTAKKSMVLKELIATGETKKEAVSKVKKRGSLFLYTKFMRLEGENPAESLFSGKALLFDGFVVDSPAF